MLILHLSPVALGVNIEIKILVGSFGKVNSHYNNTLRLSQWRRCLNNIQSDLFLNELKISLSLSFSGLQTSQDARFYAASARFDPFSNEGKSLVIQFTVKHEQKIDCGGGYVKVFPADLEQTEMHGESSYYIMFGK